MLRRIRGPLSLMTALAFILALAGPLAAPQAAHAAGTINLSASTISANTTITVTGSGFHPGDAVVVFSDVKTSAGTQRIQTSSVVNANGTFSATIRYGGNVLPGTYTVTAKDYHGQTASKSVQILPVITLIPGTHPHAVNISPGESFFVYGSGYKPGENVQIAMGFPLYNGNTLSVSRTVTANQQGAFSVTLTAPANAKQTTVNVTATGTASKKTAGAQANVVYHPTLTVTPQVPPGGTVTIYGNHYVPDSTVHVSVSTTLSNGTTQTLTRTVTVNGTGGFGTSITLPRDMKPGTYTVTATDPNSGLRASSAFSSVIKAAISVSPATAAPGSFATVTGTGFTANTTITVSAAFPLYGGGSRTVSVQARTNANGAFTTRVRVPAHAASSAATVTATEPHASASARLSIGALKTILTASPATVTPGGSVTITGQGYLPFAHITVSTQVHLTSGGNRTLTQTVTANKQGWFQTRVSIPADIAGGSYAVSATSQTSGRSASAHFSVQQAKTTLAVSPASVIPGGTVTVSGSGYLGGDTITVTTQVRLTNGAMRTLSQTVTTDKNGAFTAHFQIPTNATGGSYAVSVASRAYKRTASGRFAVAALAPSVIVTPTTAAPGTPVQVNGFGFAANETVTVTLNGQKVGTANTDATGKFTFKFTPATSLATGTYTVAATAPNGRNAKINLAVNRSVSTHFYLASEYTGTGYHEYIAFLNPTETQARVTITYDLKGGATKTKVITVGPHSRLTEDVDADLGPKVSAAAAIAADVPIIAERAVYHQYDGSIVPAVASPATTWYFANGNTGRGYREYIAMQNPNSGPVRVALHILPTHSRAFTVYRTLPPTSRLTVKINSLVKKDAVGVILTSNGPIVANRTIFIKRGMTSKIGVNAPQTHWYFAAGPQNRSAHYWIGAINPSNHSVYVTVRAFGANGTQIGSSSGWVKAYGRVGYLINRIAHTTDAAVMVTSSAGIIAEQTSYVGKRHAQSTDTFGVPAPLHTWDFAAVNTTNGDHDSLDLFNPNLLPVPVVVQFMNGATVSTRTYVVNPLAHTMVDVNSVMPNSQIGVVAASNNPVVVLNRYTFNNGLGSATSSGVQG